MLEGECKDLVLEGECKVVVLEEVCEDVGSVEFKM